ncbi:acyl carrier protein [sulfur-oxidizing endosymbiont of Gigantopelta aegis]|uniref:acyl carrier protein n=1 Tax=sulfur-oxidizing endosymbiont of Gigantopelta aegis TaxID=2794934 RepID=UPI0018DB1D73|nr:acyl carrier protein [sulfur-oxidizing endosymbiont of Gigantopelta aegis]
MSNRETYNEVFTKIFNINESDLAGLKYQDIKGWDSVGHMQLMASLEDAFAIELDIDDVIDFSSYEEGINILKKYAVEI